MLIKMIMKENWKKSKSKFIPLLIFRTCDPIIQAAYKANGGQSGGAKEEDIADDLWGSYKWLFLYYLFY